MKTEIRVNGRLQIELIPETPIETLVLQEMFDGASKGKGVSLQIGSASDGYVVAVEK